MLLPETDWAMTSTCSFGNRRLGLLTIQSSIAFSAILTSDAAFRHSADHPQEFTQGHHSDPLVFFEYQHCSIAGHNHFGMGCKRAFENAVIGLIAQDSQCFPGMNDFPSSVKYCTAKQE